MRSVSSTALIALALTLGACGTSNRGLESVHQPVVSRTDYVIDVATGGDGLAPSERDRLAAWFGSIKLGYGDKIALDDPSGYRSSGTHDAVASLAARYGLLLSDSAPTTAGEVAPGTVRVVVSRSVATVPHCPDWSRSSQPEFVGSSMSNYGCATNSNLAAMIANPEDLIHGQDPTGGTDVRVSDKAIKTYREAATTGAAGLKSEATKGGK